MALRANSIIPHYVVINEIGSKKKRNRQNPSRF
jgi:hypothetical protein